MSICRVRGQSTPRPDDVRLLGPRERTALAIAASEGRVTRQALVDTADVSPRTAARVLADLVAAGRLVPDGRRGKHAGYALPERAAA